MVKMTARHICQFCEKSFQLRYQLTVHEKVHVDEKTIQIKAKGNSSSIHSVPIIVEPPPSATADELQDDSGQLENIVEKEAEIKPKTARSARNIKKTLEIDAEAQKKISANYGPKNQNGHVIKDTATPPRRTTRVSKKRTIDEDKEEVMNYIKLISKTDPLPISPKNLTQDPTLSKNELGEDQKLVNPKHKLWEPNDEKDVKKFFENAQNSTRSSDRVKKKKNLTRKSSASSSSSSTTKKQGRRQDKKGPQKCPMCSKMISWSSSLVRHLRVHTGEKPYGCPTCGKSFTQHGVLIRHQQTHLKIPSKNAPLCDKKFGHKPRLSKHVSRQVVHTSQGNGAQKTHVCSICCKAVVSASALKRHEKRHKIIEEKRLVCKFSNNCGKNFVDAISLRRHHEQCIHGGKMKKGNMEKVKKKHGCKICQKIFANYNLLQRHYQTRHDDEEEEKDVKCQNCNKYFSTATQLMVHQERKGCVKF